MSKPKIPLAGIPLAGRPLLLALALLPFAGCAGDDPGSGPGQAVESAGPAPTEAPEPLSVPGDTTRADSADASTVR